MVNAQFVLTAAVTISAIRADTLVDYTQIYGVVKTHYGGLVADYAKTLKAVSDGKTKTVPSAASVNKEICQDPAKNIPKHQQLTTNVAMKVASLENAADLIVSDDRYDEVQVLNDYVLQAIIGEACGLNTNAVKYLSGRGRHIAIRALAFREAIGKKLKIGDD